MSAAGPFKFILVLEVYLLFFISLGEERSLCKDNVYKKPLHAYEFKIITINCQ